MVLKAEEEEDYLVRSCEKWSISDGKEGEEFPTDNKTKEG
jgi:hypothetical protein